MIAILRTAATTLPLLAIAACATAGATLGSGVGDTMLEHPPYYSGASLASVKRDTSRVGWLPIVYQGGARTSIFDVKSAAGTPMGELLADMNRYIDSTLASSGVRLVEGSAPVASAPDVRFGCTTESSVDEDCEPRDDTQALGRKGTRMWLAVARPSRDWISWMQGATAARGLGRTLVVTVEVGQYLTLQRGLRGEKIVELGTAHEEKLPWLTSLETPVMVLQLTGALVDRDGRAIRIGAEGMMVKRTGILASSVGAQELIHDDDIRRFRGQRRQDLGGAPLTWRVALDNLLNQLGVAP